MDSGLTGNFEVKVGGDLLHSKKTKNEGFLESNEDTYKKVLERILKKGSGAECAK